MGGSIGAAMYGATSISSDYWDTTTSGIAIPSQGAGNVENVPGIAGLTSSQLEAALPSGFDPAIWGQSTGINSGFPYLLSLVPGHFARQPQQHRPHAAGVPPRRH
jgi:hypothetical protein